MFIKTTDPLGIKNATIKQLVCQEGSITARRTTKCRRLKTITPYTLPAGIAECLGYVIAPGTITATVTITPAVGDTTSSTYYSGSWTMATGFNGDSWEAFGSRPIVGILPFRAFYLDHCCADGLWSLAFIPPAGAHSQALGDFAGSGACFLGRQPTGPTTPPTGFVAATDGTISGTLSFTGTAGSGYGTLTVGTVASILFS